MDDKLIAYGCNNNNIFPYDQKQSLTDQIICIIELDCDGKVTI